MKEDTVRRENLVYSATTNRGCPSDLVTGMGVELTKEDIWEKTSELLEIGHWANNKQIQEWIRGFSTDRYTTLEKLLKQKEKSGELRVDHYGRPKVYAKPMKTRGAPTNHRPYLYHELSCTKFYLKVQKSKKGTGIPPSAFRGYGVIPDFGVEYLNSVLLCEFESSIDTNYHKRLEGKLIVYDNHLYKFEEAYKLPIVVLFVLDVDRELVKKKVEEYQPNSNIFFCDYQTLKSDSNVLGSPIWIWKDGQDYSITK